MKWLVRFLFLALCFCIMSCSASCLLYLHNDTSSDFNYKISVDIDPSSVSPNKTGTVKSHEFVQALSFEPYSLALPGHQIDYLELEITKNGKATTHRFEKNGLPPNMKPSSREGVSYVRVTQDGVTVGSGSSDWWTDLGDSIWYYFPCYFFAFGLLAVALATRLLTKHVWSKKR